jgi:glycosyltransferase involved in cell wall biosynthesis
VCLACLLLTEPAKALASHKEFIEVPLAAVPNCANVFLAVQKKINALPYGLRVNRASLIDGRAINILFVHAGAELYGADRILLELLSGLKENAFGLHVVLPREGPLTSEIHGLGVPVYLKNLGVLRRKYMSPLGLLNRAYRIILAIWFLRKMIRTHSIDVIHSNTTAVFSGVLAARFCGIKHVWHVHEITTRPLWFARLIARIVAGLSDKAVFVSRSAMDHMISLCPSVRTIAVLIHNGIDDTRATTGKRGVVRAERGWNESNPLVGMIGRINWWKGQSKLVECAATLTPDLPNLRFLMVGGTFDGDESTRDSLLLSLDQLQLQEKVIIQDFRPDIGNVLADIDVFILPSTEPDPFPTVVLEAMAAGKPVVAFRHGGVCEMVDDGLTGILCEPCDVVQMQRAIGQLISSPDQAKALGLAGRSKLNRLFTQKAFIQNFCAVYAGLVSR